MLRALFFDFNGVLIDDESIHFRTFQRVLKEEGIDLSENEYMETYLARDDKACFTGALKGAGRGVDPEKVTELIGRKSRYYDEAVSNGFAIFPGADTFIRTAAEKYPTGVVSGALRNEIDRALKELRLEGVFKVIVSAEDVKRSKPDPACYKLALERLNQTLKAENQIRPAECIVFEDATGGVIAAKRAGMKCIALLNTYNRSALKAADLCVASLGDLTLKELEAL